MTVGAIWSLSSQLLVTNPTFASSPLTRPPKSGEFLEVSRKCLAMNLPLEPNTVLENGERVEADVLIGADGISSVIRDGLHGAAAPRYAGYTAWRGICEDSGLLPERSALLVMGGGSQFGQSGLAGRAWAHSND